MKGLAIVAGDWLGGNKDKTIRYSLDRIVLSAVEQFGFVEDHNHELTPFS